QLLAADQLDDLGAEPVEDAGELDGNIAATDDDDAARQGGQVERLVRRDHMLDAGDVRHRRVRASGDQNLVGGVSSAVDLDRVRIDENSPPLNQLDPAVLQHVAIDLRE